MPYLNTDQRALVQLYLLRAAGDDDLAAAFGIGVDGLADIGARILADAAREHDALDLQLGIEIGFRTHLTEAYVEPLLAVADADWHRNHEDVISALDDLRRPEAVDAFVRAVFAKYPCRAYDTYGALASKAIWALGNVATPASVAALERIATSAELPIVQSGAVEQLERVAEKAPDDAVRAAAAAALERLGPPG